MAGERAGPGSARLVLLAGAAGMLAAWLVSGRSRVVVAALALLLLGAASMQRSLDGLVNHALAAAVLDGSEVLVRGALVADPEGQRFGADVMVRVDAYSVPAVSGAQVAGGEWTRVHRTVLARASGDEAGRLRVLGAGDAVTLAGYLSPLEGFDARRRWQHGVALLNDVEVRAFSAPSGLLFGVANRLRSAVLGGTSSLSTAERALVAGFLLGDTREIPRGVTDDFRAAGLTHLLAVSGANVAFALAVVRPGLRRFGLGGRLVGGLAVVVVFAAMTRFEPSVLRASAMAVASLGASFLGRPTSSIRLLAMAVTALMLADPFLLHSVGFALSCGACAGIAVIASPLAMRLHGPAWSREPLAVTIAAETGVAPVLIPIFGSLPVVAPLANLFAVPVAEFLGVFGLPAGVIGGLIGDALPGTRAALNLPAVAAVRWIAGVADLAAHVPYAIGPRTLVAGVPLLLAVRAARGTTGRLRTRPDSLPGDAGEAVPVDPPRR